MRIGALLLVFGICMLSACGPSKTLAPVVERRWVSFNPNATRHRVVRGETLDAVAFRYDADYRVLAAVNRLRPPYTLYVGQVLRITHQPLLVHTPRRSVIKKSVVVQPIVITHVSGWRMPATGRISARFNPAQGRKGIDIMGSPGENVVASATGVVAYAGEGLPGYGNLIIIKHSQQYLTAYAHNARNLVREGQIIQAGSVIAKMGMLDKQHAGLHFEMRQQGQPVDPLKYLR
jgi:lipoprotein NlpD